MKAGLVGDSYPERSLNEDAQRTINLYPIVDPHGKEPSALYGRPGLFYSDSTQNEPGRGIFNTHDDQLYMVAGDNLWRVMGGLGYSNFGPLDTSTGPVTFAENGLQLAVCDGQSVYILTYATDIFAKVLDVDLPSAGTIEFIDGYFVINKNGSGSFYISALYDGTSWAALDFATAESSPDDLYRVKSALGQLWLQGKLSTEVWTNTGASAFPFERISGGKIDIGILAPYTSLELDNTLFFVGKSRTVTAAVYRMNGFTPQRISTSPIERMIQKATKDTYGSGSFSNIVAYTYEEDGHLFYCITGGNLETSLCYDVSTQLWHERAFLSSTGELEQHIVNGTAHRQGTIWACNRLNGNKLEQSLNYKIDQYDNVGTREIVAERVFTHLSKEGQRIRYNQLEVAIESGVGFEAGVDPVTGETATVDPVMELYISGDGGHTYAGGYQAAMGREGKTKTRVVWRRLGTYRDMTIKIRCSDMCKKAFIGAYLT